MMNSENYPTDHELTIEAQAWEAIRQWQEALGKTQEEATELYLYWLENYQANQ